MITGVQVAKVIPKSRNKDFKKKRHIHSRHTKMVEWHKKRKELGIDG